MRKIGLMEVRDDGGVDSLDLFEAFGAAVDDCAFGVLEGLGCMHGNLIEAFVF